MASRPSPADAHRLVEVAVRYADHGWPVLPLHSPKDGGCSCRVADCGSPGKHPRTPRGLHQATTDTDQVRAWWDRWPHANIGIATGTDSGLLVLDVDLPEGPDSLARLEHEHGRLPATCEQRTGSGGRQLLFAHPDRPVGNRAGVVAGIDVRGEGGYVVVPPSVHTSGRRYEWTGRTTPARIPGWLLEVLDRRDDHRTSPTVLHAPSMPLPDGSRQQRYATAALRLELADLAVAAEGTRNATLNRAAFSLGQLVGAGLLDHGEAAAELERVAADIGLGATEIRRTVASGLSAGLNQPRALLDPSPARAAVLADRSLVPPVRRIGARRR